MKVDATTVPPACAQGHGRTRGSSAQAVSRWGISVALLCVGLSACSATTSGGSRSAASPTATSPTATVAIGGPVLSAFPPAVVPSNAVKDGPFSNPGQIAAYDLPAGIDAAAVRSWYATQMPPNKPFKGLLFAETDNMPAGYPDWYWCSATPGKTLDVSVVQNGATGPDPYQTTVFVDFQDDTGTPTCATLASMQALESAAGSS
jgi:hypothetical protein